MAVGFALAGALGACSSGSDSEGGSPSPADRAAAELAAGDALVGMEESLLVADTFFKLDPDLDPNGTAAQNLDTIKANVAADGGSCANVAPAAGGIVVDFGAGCTLNNGLVFAGNVKLELGKVDTSKELKLTLTFTAFSVDDFDLDGTAALTTTTGSTFAVALDLTHASAHLTADLQVVGAQTGITMDGAASYTAAGSSSAAALTTTGVVFAPQQCWASAGSVQVQQSKLAETLAFDTSTPTTGQASVVIGSLPPSCHALPAYSSCVPVVCPTQ